jgi:membrane-bound lytic murein transglycosylase D
VYRVKRGDTIGHIAEWYGCRAADIRNWNDIAYGRPIIVGTAITVWVPRKGAERYARIDAMSLEEKQSSLRSVPPRDVPAEGQGLSYVVRSGDTLDRIARAHNTTVANLQRWNKLRSHRIQPNQVLILFPEPRVESSAGDRTGGEERQIHRVRRGDTLGTIARSYGVPMASLRRWNDLKDGRIFAGQELVIYPASRAAAVTQ